MDRSIAAVFFTSGVTKRSMRETCKSLDALFVATAFT